MTTTNEVMVAALNEARPVLEALQAAHPLPDHDSAVGHGKALRLVRAAMAAAKAPAPSLMEIEGLVMRYASAAMAAGTPTGLPEFDDLMAAVRGAVQP